MRTTPSPPTYIGTKINKNPSLAAMAKQWISSMRKQHTEQIYQTDEYHAGSHMMERARYIFNVAQIDNGFLIFYTGQDTHTGYHPSPSNNSNHVRYCKDVNEIPAVLTSLTAQLRLNV